MLSLVIHVGHTGFVEYDQHAETEHDAELLQAAHDALGDYTNDDNVVNIIFRHKTKCEVPDRASRVLPVYGRDKAAKKPPRAMLSRTYHRLSNPETRVSWLRTCRRACNFTGRAHHVLSPLCRRLRMADAAIVVLSTLLLEADLTSITIYHNTLFYFVY